jgi:hypothetical protein
MMQMYMEMLHDLIEPENSRVSIHEEQDEIYVQG